ncbi:hypothetical protein GP5015_2089 [gamma proteobacterium HTCC5015]|nr:hypothetical protein GP5015_2089 [gamma proteobacterium HTCC5015]
MKATAIKALLVLITASGLLACESSSSGSQQDETLDGFWTGKQTLLEADCSGQSDAVDVGKTETFYLTIEEDQLDIAISPSNILGLEAGALTESPLGFSGSYVGDESAVSVELRYSGGTTVMEHSEDFKHLGPVEVDYAPRGCISGRYKIVLNKTDASGEDVYARARAAAPSLGKRDTTTGSLNADGYALYKMALTQGDTQEFSITTGGEAFDAIIYDSQGKQRTGGSSGGCSTGQSEDVCFQWRVIFDRTYYLFLQSQDGTASSAFTIETDFTPREE